MSLFKGNRYIGLLGLLGFIGLIQADYYFYMYFVFFLWFATPKGNRSDERWGRNLNRAARNGFIVLLFSSMFNVAFLNATSIFTIVSATLPLGAMLVYLLSYAYYNRRGD